MPSWLAAHAADTVATGTPLRAPYIIAHRGASGVRPEHTLAAYYAAIVAGADFIEPDLVPTRDGTLIARHETALAAVALNEAGAIERDGAGTPRVVFASTNVAQLDEFRDRLTVKPVDGRLIGGWFVEDFTVGEIRRLRARERMPGIRAGSRRFDDRFGIPTLTDIVELVRFAESHTGRAVGIYPELKHPVYFARAGRRQDGSPIGHDTAALLLTTLRKLRFTAPDRVFVQSFEIEPLLRLARELMPEAGVDWPLIQLVGRTGPGSNSLPHDVAWHVANGSDLDAVYPGLSGDLGGIGPDTTWNRLIEPAGLAAIAEHYATGIGPSRFALFRFTSGPLPDGRLPRPSSLSGLLADAVRAGLVVHPFTLRAESAFQFPDANMASEAVTLWCAGADAIFSDHPGRLRAIRARFRPRACP